MKDMKERKERVYRFLISNGIRPYKKDFLEMEVKAVFHPIGGQLLGCVSFKEQVVDDEVRVWFYNLFVREDYRGCDIGRALIQSIIYYLHSGSVLCCSYSRAWQREYYEKLGFQKLKGFRQMYKIV